MYNIMNVSLFFIVYVLMSLVMGKILKRNKRKTFETIIRESLLAAVIYWLIAMAIQWLK
ncbi:hypothetical protein IZY60_11580 [Lutibacter sp. B2]|nr:hypothetical protein [Lutibacter sp. B2]